MKSFYITTPIYYVNDKPHLGTAYSTTLADILNRYHQFFGFSTRFLTGLDEHGQKCQQAADLKKVSSQAHCDQMTEVFKETWAKLGIQYDQFYRTSNPAHKVLVQKALQKLHDSGYIYESTYEGWYCISDETFYTEKDLVDGLSPSGNPVTRIKEKNYFFRLSKFKQPILDHLKKNPEFIIPAHRQNEVSGFLNKDLSDLCISRPKSRMKWGIELPFDSDYMVYVWVDALLNYVFGAGLWCEDIKDPEYLPNEKEFERWWGSSFHLIGKDILITHSVYWLGLLLALNLPLPKKIISHGWLLNKDQEKMSKSKGQVIDPIQITEKIGTDSLRYFFIKYIKLGLDSPVSTSAIVDEYNQDLSNNLGNLLQRVSKLIHDHFDSKVPDCAEKNKDEKMNLLISQTEQVYKSLRIDIESFVPEKGIRSLMKLLDSTNKYLEDTQPWKLVKTDKEKTGAVLYVSLEVVRVVTSLLQPVMPASTQEILRRIGLKDQSYDQIPSSSLKSGQVIEHGSPIYPRVSL